jgi:hypothetical protein
MRVVLERSGGFGGLRRTTRLEPGGLAAADEDRLRSAAGAARFFALPAELRAARRSPDRFAYRLEIEDGPRRGEVRFDEEAAPEELRRLVELVEELGGG